MRVIESLLRGTTNSLSHGAGLITWTKDSPCVDKRTKREGRRDRVYSSTAASRLSLPLSLPLSLSLSLYRYLSLPPPLPLSRK